MKTLNYQILTLKLILVLQDIEHGNILEKISINILLKSNNATICLIMHVS